MNIIKYNRANKKNTTIGTVTNSSSSSSTVTSTPSSSIELDRELWGNVDKGDDIDSTIFVNGSVYAYPDKYESREENDSDIYQDSTFTKFDDDNGGNIYAQNKIEGDSVYGKTLYLNYPTKSSEKKDLLDVLASLTGMKWAEFD